jgi:TonB family protein
MAVINYDLVRWSVRKWLLVLIVITVFHLGLLWKLSAPTPHTRQIYPRVPKVELGINTPSQHVSLPLLELEDPMLFAAAHPHGFSGVAWVKKPQRNYALQTRLPAQTYLDTRAGLGIFSSQSESHSLPSPSLPRARITAPPLSVAQPAPSGASELRIEGPLSSRKLLSGVQLPVQRHNDAVGSTVVETGVSPEGTVLSARVITPSGSKKADQDALAITRTLRFQPVAGIIPAASEGKFTWGKLIFDWFALDLAGTNAPAK